MKLILTHEVSGLGSPGDIVEVKDGYGRNYLLPRKYAIRWTRGAGKQVESIKKARDARAIHDLDDAKALKQKLESNAVKVKARAGDEGRLFGAVTVSDIAVALEGAGADVDKRRIEIGNAIKALGSYDVQVRVHPEVTAKVTINVVAA
ncbi:50S ribosomal protein L9 [Mumia zhuanghuii]|uniref:Large ribosomal subunit protein bL9 n=1 Tax=Mumia zhuanghuii TaxID=2585211 RepID=A0A5C4MHY3_9ACTN|nr:50S ribosomal protein L9 [Mumia zhuanghuii]TNC44236.1 50S ribosomal protein L9 [Mumia zhuanghuii]TNC52154.1 50S ribosomal protein L9 [Mumia zhuanghuii]